MKKWQFRSRADNRTEPEKFCESLNISRQLAALLWKRGISSEREAGLFLSPYLRYLAQPSAFPGISEAAKVLAEGLRSGKKLAVWGDYDVDGITATTLVVEVVRHYGYAVEWHLPERQNEGYGLNIEHIKMLSENGINMLMTVDCGISDLEAVAAARELGMTVIVTDHHLPLEQLPNANVLCNPRLKECPCRTLAGVGVAFFLMAELNTLLSGGDSTIKKDMRDTLDLVALGTLADMVPLDSQNRILVKNGLLKISEAARPGLFALKEVSGVTPQTRMTSGQVVFRLAPRINAAGRMADAALSLRLLCSRDLQAARKLAEELNDHNIARRQEEERITEQAHYFALEQMRNPALVIVGEEWNQGVIGIVASRMVERYNKPTLILCRDGDSYKGSGRSIEGFDLHGALAQCEADLLAYGGHKMAAGVRVLPEKLSDFTRHFVAFTRETLGEKPIEQTLLLDGTLNFAEAQNFVFLKELEEMQPFGIGNPEPVFASPVLLVRNRTLFGALKNHVNLELLDEGCNVSLHVKGWWQTEQLPENMKNRRIVIAYSPAIDYYNGSASVSIKIKDWHFVE